MHLASQNYNVQYLKNRY